MMIKVFCFLWVTLLSGALWAQSGTLKIGQAAPEISLPAPNGNTVTLASLKGKLVLIDFWASWCGPCVKEQPVLKALYNKHLNQIKAGKFEILGVSLDKSMENWQKAIERYKINWLQVSDLKFWKSQVANDYALEGLPYNVVVNEQGSIVAIDLHGKKLAQFISSYLKTMP